MMRKEHFRLSACSPAMRPLVLSTPRARDIRVPNRCPSFLGHAMKARVAQCCLFVGICLTAVAAISWYATQATSGGPDDDHDAQGASATAAPAESTQLPIVDAAQLQVGDACFVKVKRGDAQDDGYGVVIAVNDRWLVLGSQIREGRYREAGLLSKMPLVGRFFREPAPSKYDVNYWIPIEVAVVQQRTTSNWSGPELFKLDALHADCTCHVIFSADRATVSQIQGSIVTATKDEVTIACQNGGNHQKVPVADLLALAVIGPPREIR